jgi:hypothetical protein
MKPLIIFLLRGEFEILWFLITFQEHTWDLKLVPILRMTPVYLVFVVPKLLASLLKLLVKLALDHVDMSICQVKLLVQSVLWLGYVFPGAARPPHHHLFKDCNAL